MISGLVNRKIGFQKDKLLNPGNYIVTDETIRAIPEFRQGN
jgi:hypothetical protein